MAKILLFSRATGKIQHLNTHTNQLVDLGAAIATTDATSAFDGRITNAVAIFRGEPYVALRDVTNNVRIYRYTSGSWNLVFTQAATVGGTMRCFGLEVLNDTLYATIIEDTAAGRYHYARTTNGTAWTVTFQAQGAMGSAGHVLKFKGVIWTATALGVHFQDPAVVGWSGGFMTGNDANMAGAAMAGGCFTYWNGNLYFIKPDVGALPQLYRLDPAWDKSQIAGIRWTNQAATGFPNAGVLALAFDGGQYCLFVNKDDELCLLYSGPNGTFAAKTTAATYPVFTDITLATLPANISALTNAAISLYEDDRRRTNEQHYFLIRDTVANDTYLMYWDGASIMEQRTVLSGQRFFAPQDTKADLRTFTDQQPAVYFGTGAFSQPFPGQVQLDYVLVDSGARPCDLSAEYSLDGDQWFPMTAGEGGDGVSGLISAAWPGQAHTFIWDAYIDLDGDVTPQMRLVPRISGV